jgi:hypothetical protein
MTKVQVTLVGHWSLFALGAKTMSGYKLFWLILVCAITPGTSGCGSSDSGSGPSMDQLAGAVDAQNAARKKEAEGAAARKAEDDRKAAEQAQATPAPAPEKKAVGSRPAMEGGGYLRAIGSARRHVMNVVDNIAWIQGVRSFKAEEGRKPKNNDEFKKVVVRYDLQLPRLEEDEEYLYDPNGETDGDFGQLYIVKKQTATAAPAPSSSQPPAPPPGNK